MTPEERKEYKNQRCQKWYRENKERARRCCAENRKKRKLLALETQSTKQKLEPITSNENSMSPEIAAYALANIAYDTIPERARESLRRKGMTVSTSDYREWLKTMKPEDFAKGAHAVLTEEHKRVALSHPLIKTLKPQTLYILFRKEGLPAVSWQLILGWLAEIQPTLPERASSITPEVEQLLLNNVAASSKASTCVTYANARGFKISRSDVEEWKKKTPDDMFRYHNPSQLYSAKASERWHGSNQVQDPEVVPMISGPEPKVSPELKQAIVDALFQRTDQTVDQVCQSFGVSRTWAAKSHPNIPFPWTCVACGSRHAKDAYSIGGDQFSSKCPNCRDQNSERYEKTGPNWWREERDESFRFDWAAYFAANPNVKIEKIEPVVLDQTEGDSDTKLVESLDLFPYNEGEGSEPNDPEHPNSN